MYIYTLDKYTLRILSLLVVFFDLVAIDGKLYYSKYAFSLSGLWLHYRSYFLIFPDILILVSFALPPWIPIHILCRWPLDFSTVQSLLTWIRAFGQMVLIKI